MGPPLGGVVVFAHEWEKIIVPMMSATGIPGINIFSKRFIFNLS